MFNSKLLEQSMEKLKQGDVSSFDIIYKETHRLVFYVIYQILQNKTLCEDIMQDVYIKVYQKISTYQNQNSPKAWICMIARNLALNELKRRERVQILDQDKINEIQAKYEETPLIDLASKILPEDEYLILMMCVVEGYRRREVAKIFNLSTSGVTWKLNQALTKLKKEVEVQNENQSH
ncbi:MAG TPA: RNA polymerase sigma factor [Acholeplasmataceae bacterium]|nr:RNA polymerase sigma factor [Acholeplasmataceae bacterium]